MGRVGSYWGIVVKWVSILRQDKYSSFILPVLIFTFDGYVWYIRVEGNNGECEQIIEFHST